MAYRVSTAVKFDPSFDHGQSAFKAIWDGFLGRTEMNMAIWKARLKQASPETRRKIVKDTEDRIYKLEKLKTDFITARQEGNEDKILELMKLVQKDKASQRMLAGRKVAAAGRLKEGAREQQAMFQNANPDPQAASLIDAVPKNVAALLSKIPAGASREEIMANDNMRKAAGLIRSAWDGAVSRGADTPIARDRVTNDILTRLIAAKRGGQLGTAPERRQMMVDGWTEVLAAQGKYSNRRDMQVSLFSKYDPSTLGMGREEMAAIFGFGARAFDPGAMVGKGGFGAIGVTSPEGITSAITGIDSEIGRLRGKLDQYELDMAASKEEFDWLLRGGMGNLALRPVSSRLTPSPLSDALGRYSELYRADQPYAERYLSEMEESPRRVAREGVAPYERLEMGASSPIHYLNRTINEITDLADPAISNVAPEQGVRMIQEKLREMARSVDTLTSERQIGQIPEIAGFAVGENDEGEEIIVAGEKQDLKSFLQQAQAALADDVTEQTREEWAGRIAGRLIEWQDESLRGEGKLGRIAKETEYGGELATKISETLQLKSDGDNRAYYKSLTDLYNEVAQTPSDWRGDTGDEFIRSVDQLILDPNTRNTDLFESKMGKFVQATKTLPEQAVNTNSPGSGWPDTTVPSGTI